MSDPDFDRQVQKGKQIINDYILKKYGVKVDSENWFPKDSNNKFLLIFEIDGKEWRQKFDWNNLADAPATPKIQLQLKQEIDEFFRTL